MRISKLFAVLTAVILCAMPSFRIAAEDKTDVFFDDFRRDEFAVFEGECELLKCAFDECPVGTDKIAKRVHCIGIQIEFVCFCPKSKPRKRLKADSGLYSLFS